MINNLPRIARGIVGLSIPCGKYRIFVTVFCLLCAAPVFLTAQNTAMEIETLLASRALTYAQVSRFVLEAADAAAFTDPVEAFNFARERNWLPMNAAPHEPARLDRVSLLLMRSFGIRGGVLFTLTGSPHYAYREMEYMGFIYGRASPGQTVSGDTLLYLTGRILGLVENQ